MMKTALAALLVMLCGIAAAANMNVIKFDPEDNGLVWPLPDSGDLVSVLVHAVHCKHILKMAGRNVTDTWDKMHIQHCQRVVRPIEEFVHTAALDVSQSVCNALFGLNPEYYRIRQVHSLSYFADDVLEKIDTGAVLSGSALAELAGYNYGTLLMKEYYNDPKDPLTDREREYVDSWFKPVTVQQSAIAYTCQEQHGIVVYKIEDEPGYYKTESEVQP